MMDTPPDSNATPTPPIEPSAPAPAKRSHRARWLIALIVMVVLVVAAAGLAYHFYGNPLAKACVPSPAVRHTLPCDIPLPSDATFKAHQSGTLASDEPYTEWDFTTPESLDQLTRFYATGFSADGWPCVGGTVIGDLLAVAATNKADQPDSVAFMAYQINVPMSPNEFGIVLVQHADKNSLLTHGFKCGNLSALGQQVLVPAMASPRALARQGRLFDGAASRSLILRGTNGARRHDGRRVLMRRSRSGSWPCGARSGGFWWGFYQSR